jgi:hypothetical protein
VFLCVCVCVCGIEGEGFLLVPEVEGPVYISVGTGRLFGTKEVYGRGRGFVFMTWLVYWRMGIASCSVLCAACCAVCCVLHRVGSGPFLLPSLFFFFFFLLLSRAGWLSLNYWPPSPSPRCLFKSVVYSKA